ncbi:MAG: hypothetical protein NVSMB24_37950 [Mucilaginibacter sp.]
MFKKIICTFLAGLFLATSLILPLGDFSLLREIPRMYGNYTKITSVDERGIIDFIGDYLLHGKELFGHNDHDKAAAKGDEVQFQHQAIPLCIMFANTLAVRLFLNDFHSDYSPFSPVIKASGHRDKLFRPPLA